jgi:hypothetical protein
MHHLGFAEQRDCNGGDDKASNMAGREVVQNQQPERVPITKGENKSVQGGAVVGFKASAGALSLGGKSFTIPEQVAALLWQAFEAMTKSAAGSSHAKGKVGVDKGKEMIRLTQRRK